MRARRSKNVVPDEIASCFIVPELRGRTDGSMVDDNTGVVERAGTASQPLLPGFGRFRNRRDRLRLVHRACADVALGCAEIHAAKAERLIEGKRPEPGSDKR